MKHSILVKDTESSVQNFIKPFVLIVIGVMVVLALYSALSHLGRYAIYNNGCDDIKGNKVFLLDTHSGKTWLLVNDTWKTLIPIMEQSISSVAPPESNPLPKNDAMLTVGTTKATIEGNVSESPKDIVQKRAENILRILRQNAHVPNNIAPQPMRQYVIARPIAEAKKPVVKKKVQPKKEIKPAVEEKPEWLK